MFLNKQNKRSCGCLAGIYYEDLSYHKLVQNTILKTMNNINFRLSSFKFSQYLLTDNISKPFNSARNLSRNSILEQCSHKNPYFEKYAAKIAEVQRTNPEGLKKSLEKNIKFAEANLCSKSKKNTNEERKNEIKISHFQRQKDLNHVMKLESVQGKTAEEIESIWKEYHSVKDGVYAILPAKSFDKMHSNLKEYPVFLFPLPRAQGYEFFMCQFLDQSCYFTSLINYQAFKENAPISLTVTYFTEFQKEKEIVLMRGEFDSSLKSHEAQCLTNQLQLYYGGQDEEKNNLLWKFNRQPDSFKHMDLISNFERSLGN